MTKQDEKKQDPASPDTAPDETPGQGTGPDAETPADATKGPDPAETPDAAENGSQGDSGGDETPGKRAVRERAQAAEARVSELEARVSELETLLDGSRRSVAGNMATQTSDPFAPALSRGDALFDVGGVSTGDLVNDTGDVDPDLVARAVTTVLDAYPELTRRAKVKPDSSLGKGMPVSAGGDGNGWHSLLMQRGR